MHPLDGAKFKTQRAKIHLTALRRSVRQFFSKRHYLVNYSIPGEDDPQGIHRIYDFSQMPEAPVRWGLIVGDIVSNLRISLDYIAWELSTLNRGDIPERQARSIQFPIFQKPNEPRFRQLTGFMSLDAVKEVRRFQPYPDHCADWGELSLLWILNQLSNRDKHRVLTEPFSQMNVRLSPKTSWESSFGLRKDARLVIPVKVAQSLGDDFHPEFSPDVAFSIGEGPTLADGLSIFILEDIHEFIRDQVIPRFGRFFA